MDDKEQCFSIISASHSPLLKKIYNECYIPSKGRLKIDDLLNSIAVKNIFKEYQLSIEDFIHLYSAVNLIAHKRMNLKEFPPPGTFNKEGYLNWKNELKEFDEDRVFYEFDADKEFNGFDSDINKSSSNDWKYVSSDFEIKNNLRKLYEKFRSFILFFTIYILIICIIYLLLCI